MQGDLYRSYNASAAQALTSTSGGIYALSATPAAPTPTPSPSTSTSPTQSLHLGAGAVSVSSVRYVAEPPAAAAPLARRPSPAALLYSHSAQVPTPATRPATAGAGAGRVDEAPSTAPTSSPHSRGAALGTRALGLSTRTTPASGAPAPFGLAATARTRATLAGLYGQSLVPANATATANSRYFDEDDEAELDDDGLPVRQTPDSKHVCFAFAFPSTYGYYGVVQ